MLNRIKKATVLGLSLIIILFIGCNDKDSLISNSESDEYLEKQITEITLEQNNHLDYLIEYLDLTDEQVEQVKTFLEEQRSGLKERFPREDRKWRKGDIKEKLMEFRKQMKAELNEFLLTILTDEQKVKFEEMRDNLVDIKNAKWIEKLTEELELTDEQVVQVTDILLYKSEKMEAILKGEYTLTEKRDLIAALSEEIKVKFAEVLTDEQLEKLADLMKKNKKPHGGRKHDKP